MAITSHVTPTSLGMFSAQQLPSSRCYSGGSVAKTSSAELAKNASVYLDFSASITFTREERGASLDDVPWAASHRHRAQQVALLFVVGTHETTTSEIARGRQEKHDTAGVASSRVAAWHFSLAAFILYRRLQVICMRIISTSATYLPSLAVSCFAIRAITREKDAARSRTNGALCGENSVRQWQKVCKIFPRRIISAFAGYRHGAMSVCAVLASGHFSSERWPTVHRATGDIYLVLATEQ